jgi:hypothetical protein
MKSLTIIYVNLSKRMCLKISGMTHETLKWKLFPFSLIESARQWYTTNIRSANRTGMTCEIGSVLHSLHSLVSAPCGQKFRPSVRKRESIGAAWARLSLLAQSGPDLSLPDHMLLQHLYKGLSKVDAHYLDVTVGGLFSHKSPAEGREILNKIMEKTSFVCL